MRWAVPASVPGAPVRTDAVRIRDIPVHRIRRQARIHHQTLLLNMEIRDARDLDDRWDTRDL
jgi:hypothetical protein